MRIRNLVGLTAVLAAMLLYIPNAHAQMLRVLWVDPYQGPICDGPLGPGQCQLIAQWMQQNGINNSGIPVDQQLTTALNTDIPALNSTLLSQSIGGAAQCAQLTGQYQQVNVDTFLTCTRGALVLDKDSATIVNCAEQFSNNATQFASCAGRGVLGSRISNDQLKAVNCVSSNYGNTNNIVGCMTGSFLTENLSQDQRKIINCSSQYGVGTTEFAACTAMSLYGNQIPREAQAAVACAVTTKGDLQAFGGCAANAYLKLNLNPEQQIGVQCVLSSGGQPYVAAGCAASRLTFRELNKCLENGIGGNRGCFGVNNDLVGRNGFVVRNIAALAGGQNSIINDPGQILGGPGSVFNNPRQLLGGPNSVVSQALKNIPSPPPLQVGKIGKHRVCIPWC